MLDPRGNPVSYPAPAKGQAPASGSRPLCPGLVHTEHLKSLGHPQQGESLLPFVLPGELGPGENLERTQRTAQQGTGLEQKRSWCCILSPVNFPPCT